jgi:hypothetical protein|tara:strand:- start:40 stop:249 length:210 start_codon:yes stop_codon:yes gene_type:complete
MLRLTGWYETEYGANMVDVQGNNLYACVQHYMLEDEDFGHTDMELEISGEDGVAKDVTMFVHRMIRNEV